jgi:hypothetical protein
MESVGVHEVGRRVDLIPIDVKASQNFPFASNLDEDSVTPSRDALSDPCETQNILRDALSQQKVQLAMAILPSDLAERFWSRVRILNVAPASQKLEGFRACAHDVKRLIGLTLPPADIADRLYEVALSTGIVLEWGEEVVQAILAEALASPAEDFEEDGALDDDDARPPPI